jgi:hypothetical protein
MGDATVSRQRLAQISAEQLSVAPSDAPASVPTSTSVPVPTVAPVRPPPKWVAKSERPPGPPLPRRPVDRVVREPLEAAHNADRFDRYERPIGSSRRAPVVPLAVDRLNSLAVIAFVCSFFISLIGIVCGHMALSEIRRTGERGAGLATAALVIGYLGLALAVGYILLIVAAIGAMQ